MTANGNAPGNQDLSQQIRAIKQRLGSRLVMPAHHYQRAEIVALADFIGDSYRLAKEGAAAQADYIVFCGVRFMAESAAILARPGQKVLIPDPVAGCPMADMIEAEAAETILQSLDKLCGQTVIPLTYMNSYADMKALTGRRGGAICTSSNAAKLLTHYFAAGQPVFFGPDYNLGINTARQLKLPAAEIFRVARDGSRHGLVLDADPAKARLYLWDGFCHVHKRFKPEDIAAARQRHPGSHIIVHPESDEAVVQAADSSGSTEAIYKAVATGQPGSSWIVGTEASFVHRIAAEFGDRLVLPLRESYCFNMARITLDNVLACLQSIESHESTAAKPLLHLVQVDEAIRSDAAAALKAMIAIVEGPALVQGGRS